MFNILKKTITMTLSVLFLAGCIASTSSSTLDIEPVASNFLSMPGDDARIATAVAVQAATTPLAQYKTVTFANGALGFSDASLGKEKFEFTDAKLYTYKVAKGAAPGVSIGEVELTDPLGRKAAILYRAEYTKEGEQITLTTLRMERVYTATPRVKVTVIPATDLPKKKISTYMELIQFLADKGLSPAELATAGNQKYAVFAVGKDWVGPEGKLTIAISASKTGIGGHKKGSNSSLIEGLWPMAVTVGTIDTTSTKDKLYAKISFKKEGGFSSSKIVGVYQLSAFNK